MIFGNDRKQLRQSFQLAWEKARSGQILTPLEQQIAAVIADHPEYHALLTDPDSLERDFTPAQGQENPFLHMAMHLAIREQVATDRPAGIRAIHRTLARRLSGVLAAEHVMLECLGIVLWEAQRSNRMPDEAEYLARLQRL